MHLLKESIEKYGILTPLIVRPVLDGVYEIIVGHRRRHAAELLGYRKVPVIIRVMNEDEAILSMADSRHSQVDMVPDDVDAELLAKVLQASLAKAMK